MNAATIVNESNAIEIAENKISSFGEYSLDYCTYLFNPDLSTTAICCSFSPSGYVIVDLNLYSITEFSPTSSSPFPLVNSEQQYSVYIGPMNYYSTIDGITFINLSTGAQISKDDLTVNDSPCPAYDNQNYLLSNKAQTRGSSFTIATSNTPVTWSSSYYCGVDGCAIILKYLDMYHNTLLLDSNMDENNELQAYLVNNKYIPNSGVLSWQVVSGLGSYTGINDFFSDRNTSFAAVSGTYTINNLSSLQASFQQNYPALIEIYNSEIWSSGQHFLIIYGYNFDGSNEYFIANDGFGRANLYFSCDPQYYGSMIRFNQ